MKIVFWMIGLFFGIVTTLLCGCGIEAYGGFKTESFYPKSFNTGGDPREGRYVQKEEPGGVSVGGHRSGFNTLGGDK